MKYIQELCIQNILTEIYNLYFFGSALNNFGVREFTRLFCWHCSILKPKKSVKLVEPNEEKKLSGFVFQLTD
jgi:peptide subunit release factor RF-3